jgi:ribonuclease-3
MNSNLQDLKDTINVQFNNDEFLKEALIHRSYQANDDLGNNERLEFLGDAVLELAVTEFLFETYPKRSEGDLTSFRAALVRTESLAEEALRLGFGEFIYMSNGEESTGGRTRPYILANTVEAIIGAIYRDQGYEPAKNFIIKEICHKIDDIVENRLDIDAKSKLQEISQEQLKITPNYEMIDSEGPDHQKVFTMGVLLDGSKLTEAKGDSKQSAEQNAAQKALENWDNLIEKHFPEINND